MFADYALLVVRTLGILQRRSLSIATYLVGKWLFSGYLAVFSRCVALISDLLARILGTLSSHVEVG